MSSLLIKTLTFSKEYKFKTKTKIKSELHVAKFYCPGVQCQIVNLYDMFPNASELKYACKVCIKSMLTY